MNQMQKRNPGPLHYALALSLVTNVVLVATFLGDDGPMAPSVREAPRAARPATALRVDAAEARATSERDATWALAVAEGAGVVLPGFGFVPWSELRTDYARAGVDVPGFGFFPFDVAEPAYDPYGPARPEVLRASAGAAHAVDAPGPSAGAVAAVEPAPRPTPTAATGVQVPGLDGAVRLLDLRIQRSIPHTIRAAAPELNHSALAAQVGQALASSLDPSRDLRPDDPVRLLVSEGDAGTVHAVIYESQRHGRVFRAYRVALEGEAQTWWDENGAALEAGARTTIPDAGRPALHALVEAVGANRA